MRILYDSTSITDIPPAAPMVGYYVDGRYATSAAAVLARFPRAVLVPISCLGSDAGVVGDVETGCLSLPGFLDWMARRRARGLTVTAYVNRANHPALLAACAAARVAPPLCWLSTLDGSTPWGPGIVAIQTAGQRLTGQHYDVSDVLDHWPGVDSPPPPTTMRTMLFLRNATTGDLYIFGASGHRKLELGEWQQWAASGATYRDVDPAVLAAILAERAG